MNAHEPKFTSNPLLVLANAALGEHWSRRLDMAGTPVTSDSNIEDTAVEDITSDNGQSQETSGNKTLHDSCQVIKRNEKHEQNPITSPDGANSEVNVNNMFDQQLQRQADALSAFGITDQPALKETQAYRRNGLSGPALAACGVQPDDGYLISSLEGNEPGEPEDSERFILMNKRRRVQKIVKQPRSLPQHHKETRDFFGLFSRYPELFMELAKHMDTRSLLSLYSISKDFHETLNGHMTHVMKTCAAYQCPESSRVFVFTLYESLCRPDPVSRPHPIKVGLVRNVPSLRWLAMLVHREKAVRDILACMAREGHRMPKSMSLTLKKMWLTMDISTSCRRVQLMHNDKYWTDNDIYNVQLFVMKLDMRFNDPIDGPGDDGLKKLFLGQRGLTPLRDLLKRTRFTSIIEIIQSAVRYAGTERLGNQHQDLSLFGVPPEDVGIGHLEGWGKGKVHLYRMDELVLREAVRRNLELDKHMMDMMLWGYVNPATKENINPSAEEMYMSDDEKEVPLRDSKGKGKAKMKDDVDVEMKDADQGWETDKEEDIVEQ